MPAVAGDEHRGETGRAVREPLDHAMPHSACELVVTPSAPADNAAPTSSSVRTKPPARTGTSKSGSRLTTDGRITPGRTSTMFGRRPADRGEGGVELAAPGEEQPVDRGHALVADRRHELAVGADDGVDARRGEPGDARPIGPQAADEVDMDRDELAGGVDPPDERADVKPVAAEHEDDRRPARRASSSCSSAVIAAQRRSAAIRAMNAAASGGVYDTRASAWGRRRARRG